jgi:hypothetical protein
MLRYAHIAYLVILLYVIYRYVRYNRPKLCGVFALVTDYTKFFSTACIVCVFHYDFFFILHYPVDILNTEFVHGSC